jgi:hypothetical protein
LLSRVGAVATLCAARNTLPAAESALFLPFHVHSVLTLAVLRLRSVLLEVRRLLQEASCFSSVTFISFSTIVVLRWRCVLLEVQCLLQDVPCLFFFKFFVLVSLDVSR